MVIHSSDTKHELLEAAGRLFLHYGYRKTTIDDIAKEAGVGKGTVYLHFESKEQLGAAWLDRKTTALLEEIGLTTRKQVGAIYQIRTFLTERVLARHRLVERSQLAEDRFTEMQELVRRSRYLSLKREEAFLAELLSAGIEENTLKVEELQAAARSLILATNGLLPFAFTPHATTHSVEAALSPLIDLLIKSISK